MATYTHAKQKAVLRQAAKDQRVNGLGCRCLYITKGVIGLNVVKNIYIYKVWCIQSWMDLVMMQRQDAEASVEKGGDCLHYRSERAPMSSSKVMNSSNFIGIVNNY